jgi:nucleotide-binding universal stress UspA family protein
MGHWTRILCATDLGESADQAIREAGRMARSSDAELIVLHVLVGTFPGIPMTPEEVEQDLLLREQLVPRLMEALSERVRSIAGLPGDAFATVVDDGPAAETILRNGEQRRADLIVVAASGRLSQRLLGSVADKVVRNVHGSALVARPPRDASRVVMATDLSPASEAALPVAAEEGRRRGARLWLVTSFEAPDFTAGIASVTPLPMLTDLQVQRARAELQRRLEQALERVQSAAGEPLAAEAVVIDGSPGETVPAFAAELNADLVVVGSAGVSGLRRMMFGSVAEAIVRHSPCSVLVVRPSI